jgi:hypothetical protein
MGERATIANMGPEYGATCGLFPIDQRPSTTCASPAAPRSRSPWWRPTARPRACLAHRATPPRPTTASPEPGPRGGGTVAGRAQAPPGPGAPDRHGHPLPQGPGGPEERAQHARQRTRATVIDGQEVEIGDGSMVVAAITSCTNTSNPASCWPRAWWRRRPPSGGSRRPLGQDLARARLHGGDPVPGVGGADRAPQAARLPQRGLRLHHLHRQLGALPEPVSRRSRTTTCAPWLGPLRQPQLRGPGARRGAHELPGLPTPGGGLRHRRAHGHRSLQPSPWPPTPRA